MLRVIKLVSQILLGAFLAFAGISHLTVARGEFLAQVPAWLPQYTNRIDAFGLNTDQARFTRLFFQPVLVAWALWSTDAWRMLRRRSRSAEKP